MCAVISILHVCRRLLHYLSVLALRESAAECLREIISKGMEPLPKIELVESLAKMLLSMQILSAASEEVLKMLNFPSHCEDVHVQAHVKKSDLCFTV